MQHDITDNTIELVVLEVTVQCIERPNRQTESLKLELKLKIKGEVNNCHMKAGPGAPGEQEGQTCIGIYRLLALSTGAVVDPHSHFGPGCFLKVEKKKTIIYKAGFSVLLCD